ncbi:O-antigen ligase family protein [Alcanivorax sp.]|uniref:O-antigen ligase family protein n=1 Tax=Alcanivorax sp. TaxID=1872427 RepID=UPI0025C3C73F|nr:O-antigen ligase family protein [Alcanivorax sp.]
MSVLVATIITFFLFVAPLFDLTPGLTWHDQQRTLQVASILLSAIGLWINRHLLPVFSFKVHILVGLFFLLGVLSASLSKYPLWSFVEVFLFGGVFIVGLFAYTLTSNCSRQLVLWVMVLLSCVAALLALRFVSSVLAAFYFKADLYPDAVINGFDNVRWFGQFQALSLPVFAGLIAYTGRPLMKWGLFITLVSLWVSAIAIGNRGVWASMIAVGLLFVCLGKDYRQWLKWQLAAVTVAMSLVWFCFIYLAGEFGILGDGMGTSRDLATSSNRLDIWGYTLKGILSAPLFGAGPMGFASNYVFRVAHPHNSVLQIAYEWGIPALLVCFWLFLLFVLSVYKRIRLDSGRLHLVYVSLFAAILAVMADSLVSGVIVMPYSQLWLAVLVGVLASELKMGRAVNCSYRYPIRVKALFQISVCLSCLFLGGVILRDLPTLYPYELRPGKGGDAPRFWSQGSIHGAEGVSR